MNPSDPQEEVSQPKLSGESLATADELQYNLEGLRYLFFLALLGLIGALLAMDVCFLRRTMLTVRAQLDEQRPRINRAAADFQKGTEPVVRNFTASLQTFANTNPDFQPILDKYRPFLYPYMQPAPVVTPVSPSLKPPAALPK